MNGDSKNIYSKMCIPVNSQKTETVELTHEGVKEALELQSNESELNLEVDLDKAYETEYLQPENYKEWLSAVEEWLDSEVSHGQMSYKDKVKYESLVYYMDMLADVNEKYNAYLELKGDTSVSVKEQESVKVKAENAINKLHSAVNIRNNADTQDKNIGRLVRLDCYPKNKKGLAVLHESDKLGVTQVNLEYLSGYYKKEGLSLVPGSRLRKDGADVLVGSGSVLSEGVILLKKEYSDEDLVSGKESVTTAWLTKDEHEENMRTAEYDDGLKESLDSAETTHVTYADAELDSKVKGESTLRDDDKELAVLENSVLNELVNYGGQQDTILCQKYSYVDVNGERCYLYVPCSETLEHLTSVSEMDDSEDVDPLTLLEQSTPSWSEVNLLEDLLESADRGGDEDCQKYVNRMLELLKNQVYLEVSAYCSGDDMTNVMESYDNMATLLNKINSTINSSEEEAALRLYVEDSETGTTINQRVRVHSYRYAEVKTQDSTEVSLVGVIYVNGEMTGVPLKTLYPDLSS